jgi:hypothetical protein
MLFEATAKSFLRYSFHSSLCARNALLFDLFKEKAPPKSKTAPIAPAESELVSTPPNEGVCWNEVSFPGDGGGVVVALVKLLDFVTVVVCVTVIVVVPELPLTVVVLTLIVVVVGEVKVDTEVIVEVWVWVVVETGEV